MKEEFLQFIWQNNLISEQSFTTTTGEKVELVEPGMLNRDSGPDFFNAKIKINNYLWAGNIEIHLKSSDWKKHKHHHDKSYDNVILHLVSEHDTEIYRTTGERIPTAILNFNPKLYFTYQELCLSNDRLPCKSKIKGTDQFVLDYWLMTLLVERLMEKSGLIMNTMAEEKNDWNEVFYRLLSRNFGFKLNSVPFEMLASSLKLSTIKKQAACLRKIEALLFGQAGFLIEPGIDLYYQELQNEYNFLKGKYGLTPIDKNIWKFMRTRPANFPTIRIAQLGGILLQHPLIFSEIIEMKTVAEIRAVFEVEASEYWDTHYQFDKESSLKKKKPGKASIDIILINTIVPFIFCYGKSLNDEVLKKRALEFLEEIAAEKNSELASWEKAGISPKNAFESQALLQLGRNYCAKKRCLQCQIGNKIIGN